MAFDYGNANVAQRNAISTTNGPVLITAGPGTGKTFTLVQRAIYLIEECGILPEQILMATFTEKAAKELITRITNELAVRNISTNVNEMYIGTFHSLCLRIIKENLEYTRLKRNYRLLDTFDQKYLVFQNISKFRDIDGFEDIMPKGAWNQADTICNYVNNLSEELVSSEKLIEDDNERINTLGYIMAEYKTLLMEGNLIDFAGIQTECYELLRREENVRQQLQERICYLMIDEYQDTNYIQEQIVFLLGEKHKNICVVGDDDQGLYRFRGATIRNILEFPYKFDNHECKIIPLVVNYRSNSDVAEVRNEVCVALELTSFGINCDGAGGNILAKSPDKIPDGYKICGYDCWWTVNANIVLNVVNYEGYISFLVSNGFSIDLQSNRYGGKVFLKKV